MYRSTTSFKALYRKRKTIFTLKVQDKIMINSYFTKSCLVYIEDFKYSGDGYYDSIFMDFESKNDYRIFTEALHLNYIQDRSFVEFVNYYSSRRLVRHAYYRLNLNLLEKFKPEIEALPDSALFAYRIQSVRLAQINQQRLFLPRNPNEDKRKSQGQIVRAQVMPELPSQSLKLQVNNVSQGNWNEIHSDGKVSIVYDMGSHINASTDELITLKIKHFPKYSGSHPTLFLSHWDADHINILRVLSSIEMKEFSAVYCVTNKPSLTSQNIYNALLKALPGKVFTIPYARYATRQVRTALWKRKGQVSAYVGQKYWNNNLSGIQLYIEGANCAALLTGDCNYKQIDNILSTENHNGPLLMVTPHHGCKPTTKPHLNTYYNNSEAIISVDENRNSYGHPTKEVLKYLSLYFHPVTRTDKVGNDIKRSF